MTRRLDPLTAEQERDGAPKAAADERMRSKRLPEAEIRGLRFLWGALPSRLGLESNFGALCERLQSLSVRAPREPAEPRARRRKVAKSVQTQALHEHLETPAESMDRRARTALSHLPGHVQIDLPPEELAPSGAARAPEPRRSRDVARRIDGVIVARGYRPDRMAVKHNGGGGNVHRVACDARNLRTGERFGGTVEALYPAEEWCECRKDCSRRGAEACPSCRERASVHVTRAALERMAAEGHGLEVVTLFALYSGEIPSPVNPWWAHPDCLDDLWPLALHTKTVHAHAAEMRTRRQVSAVTRGAPPRRVVRSSTSPLERRWLAGGEVDDPNAEAPFDASTMLAVLGLREVSYVPGLPVAVHDVAAVSLFEAASSLLDKPGVETREHAAVRVHMTAQIKLDAHHLLEHAGELYLEAKHRTGRPR